MSIVTTGILLRSAAGNVYRFDPGALCLELLTTGGPGAFGRYEVLHAPADVAAWAGRSRLTPTPELRLTEADVASARRLRDALWRVAVARTCGGLPESGVPAGTGADLDVLNEIAAPPPLVPAIGGDGERAWAGPASGTQLLSTVARDAVDLLTGAYAERVRMCAGERCHLVYVDTSRPGRRRWCSMEHCGNRHKVRALRARRAEGEAGGAPEEG